MTLSPLEMVLGTGLVALVTALVVRVWMGRNCITRHECNLKHEHEREGRERLAAEDKEMKKRVGLVFEMLRAAIEYLPIPPERKVEILNKRKEP